MDTSVTLNELGQVADRTLAYALLAGVAKSYITGIYRFREVTGQLDRLLAQLTPVVLERFAGDSTEDGARLLGRLEDLHEIIARISRSSSTFRAARLAIIRGYVHRLEEQTEDLGDFIENLALAKSSEFKNLVSCCSSSLQVQDSEEVVGRMQGSARS